MTEWRKVEAVYDPTDGSDGYYWGVPLIGGNGRVGLVTAYCSDGNTGMSPTNKCDEWVDRNLQGPYIDG